MNANIEIPGIYIRLEHADASKSKIEAPPTLHMSCITSHNPPISVLIVIKNLLAFMLPHREPEGSCKAESCCGADNTSRNNPPSSASLFIRVYESVNERSVTEMHVCSHGMRMRT